jgi:TonB-linked SusC/RagA family outer membrane protein
LSSKYLNKNLNLNANEFGTQLEFQIADGTLNVSAVDARLVQYRIDAYKNAPDVVNVEDWLFRTAKSSNHDFSVSGGSEDVKYFASLGYQNTEGIALTQGYERLNARLNVDAKIGERLKTGLSFNGFTSKRDILAWDMRDLLRAYSISPIYHTAASIQFIQDLDSQRQALYNLSIGSPGGTLTALAPSFNAGYQAGATAPFNQSIYTLQPGMTAQDWHYGRVGNGIGTTGDAGPATKLDNSQQWQKTYFVNVNTYLEYKLLEGLNVKTVLGADLNDTHDYYWRGLESDSRARTAQTNLNNTYLKKISVLSETTLNYAKEFGKHDLAAVAGVEFQNTKFEGVSIAGTNVPFGDVINYNLFAPADIITLNTDQTIVRKSVFGRVNYAYDNRYLLSVSVRRDGDSRFGANSKYATFPAFSLGWNMHKEAFLKDNETLSLFKLRFSRGSLGTTSFLGAYDALSVLKVQPTVLGTGFLIPENVANADLTWQTNTETNFGVDLAFINNRFKMSVDYYTSDINDILIKQPISEILGTSQVKLNSGDVRSSGLEFELSGSLIDIKDFSWNVGGNLSTVKTEIKSLGGLTELPRVIYGQSGRGPVFRNYVGGGIGEMWGLETLGEVEAKYIKDPTLALGSNSSAYYIKDQQSPGQPGYGVIDKTKTVEEGGDLVKLGQNTPKFYWGFSQNLRYKNVDMSMQFQGSHGAKVFNIDPIYYQSQFGGRLDVPRLDANSDRIADNGLPYLDTNNQLDATVQDASYIALRNVTIGYTFNQDLIEKVGASSIRLYAAATNLLYLWASDYTSFNPEGVQTSGSDYLGPTTYGVQNGASPVVRSFTLGLNVNF